jgi:hypothetical protein
MSPGAVQPGYTIRDICPHVNKALEAMRPSTAEKNRVYAAYGVTHHVTGQYEVDHIVPVELLGLVDAPPGNPAENLYPEPNVPADPAMMARYHLNPAFVENPKDILEDRLHQLVCAGSVPLATAQKAFETDWRAAYLKYVGPPPGRGGPPAPARAAVPPPAHSASPARAACRPRTRGGNCYRAGQICRKSDLGSAGIAGNGERIRCAADGSRNRWEPA